MKHKGLNNENAVFFGQETTYDKELMRRELLRRGISEIYFNPKEVKFQISSRIGYQQKLDLHMKPVMQVAEVRGVLTALRNQVHRKTTLSYMKTSDVRVGLEVPKENRPSTIIFMHCVSDAQYIFGQNGFTDLSDWLEECINASLELGMPTYVKIHPGFFRTDLNYPADTKYITNIQRKYGFYLKQMTPIVKTRIKNLYFIMPQVSILDLKRSFERGLIVTHHGTVTLEASYCKMNVISAANSPYRSVGYNYFDRDDLKNFYIMHKSGELSPSRGGLLQAYYAGVFTMQYLGLSFWFNGEMKGDEPDELLKLSNRIKEDNTALLGLRLRLRNALNGLPLSSVRKV